MRCVQATQGAVARKRVFEPTYSLITALLCIFETARDCQSQYHVAYLKLSWSLWISRGNSLKMGQFSQNSNPRPTFQEWQSSLRSQSRFPGTLAKGDWSSKGQNRMLKRGPREALLPCLSADLKPACSPVLRLPSALLTTISFPFCGALVFVPAAFDLWALYPLIWV